MQVRGDREHQPPADVGTACGNMTNLHVLLVMLTLMRVNPMVAMSERHSILRGTAPRIYWRPGLLGGSAGCSSWRGAGEAPVAAP